MSDASRDAGVRALQGGDPKSALQHLAQAIQQNPQDAQAHAYMGAAYGQLNMPQQAVESLTHATQLAPLSAPIRFNLAVMLEKSGRRDEAVAAYRQVVVLDGNYERARQALTRLGETATVSGSAPAAPPAYPPPAAAPPPSAPGLGDFAIGGGPSYGAAPPQASPYGAPPPQASPCGAPPPQAASPYGVPPPQASPYGAPPPMGGGAGPSSPGGAPPPMAPPSMMAPPAAPAPPGGMQPLGDWNPPPSAAPPSGGPPGGMQPLGEWSPPPGGLAAGQTAPPPPPSYAPSGGGATIAVVDHPETMLSRSAQLGHCYLTGMGMGVWWGLLGAVFTFLRSMTTVMSSDLGRMMPLILTMCAMNIALGALLYGLIGLAGGATEDAETSCGNFGLALGILGALLGGIVVSDQLLMLGGPTIIGSIWVSRKLGQSLGIKINEMQSSVFVVAGPGGVSAMSYRKH